ncbi:N-acetylmannosamine-6-phosphate 2-epimerase [Alloyangia pacifica]|uniref:N-acetylmannosamine-6-phosphate 2-epimerase n=1 Tax=Alloyangia pacifica TaxID=311180 RepID=UPI001CD48754|nr:putative N-acetylmannosamine-6-phosphate 2-epimerase [Alloyangia pacifica]MCA0997108.1 putative N-acetylmannosamine-6-phosphate 2-epimerase [Alloyangia pacifica]
MLETLRNRLIASCQPVDDGPMDRPEIVAAMAQAAVNGGAAALRIEGIDNLRAARRATDAPIIGIVKRDLDASPVRITPLVADVEALIDAGADIVAVDATTRPRPAPLETLLAVIKDGGKLAMADCSSIEDARRAKAMGFDMLGSTLSGYLGGPVPEAPDFDLLREMRALGGFIVAEGRYNSPALAADAMRAGADCVTVGSALTRLEHVTGWFSAAIERAGAGAAA